MRKPPNPIPLPNAVFLRERLGLKDFFNWVGARAFPNDWKNTDVLCLNAPHHEQTGEAADAAYRSEYVEQELSEALVAGYLQIEVDLCSVDNQQYPLISRDERGILYFQLSKEAWATESEVDWVRGTVSTKAEFIENNFEAEEMFKSRLLELTGYVVSPHAALAQILKWENSTIDAKKLEMAKKHVWAEIAAVIWRYIAVHGYGSVRGERKSLLAAVTDYLSHTSPPSREPVQSQLDACLEYVMAQYDQKDMKSSIIPTFKRPKVDRPIKKTAAKRPLS